MTEPHSDVHVEVLVYVCDGGHTHVLVGCPICEVGVGQECERFDPSTGIFVSLGRAHQEREELGERAASMDLMSMLPPLVAR